MVSSGVLNKFFLHILGFLFIFNPTNFLPFNLIYIIFFISLIYIFVNPLKTYLFISNKKIFVLISYIIFMIFYCSIFYFYFYEDSLYRAYTLLLLLMALFCSFTIVAIYQNTYGFNLNVFIKFLINIGVIQIFIVILTLFFPELRDLILSTARQNDNMVQEIANNEVGGRSFGLSQNYTSAFPMLMGVYAILTIYYLFNEKNLKLRLYYLMLTIGFSLAVMLNARVAIIPIVLAFICFYIDLFFNFSKKNKIYIFLFITIFFIFSSYVLQDIINIDFFKRFLAGMEEIKNLLNGNLDGTFEVLVNMLFLPDKTINLFFGRGYDTLGKDYLTSDIGLIRDIFMFGVLGVLFQFLILLYIFNNKFIKLNYLVYLLLAFSFILFYLKGVIFSANEFHNFLLLILSFVAMKSYQRLKV